MQRITYLLIPGLIAIALFIAISSYDSVSQDEASPLITLDYNAFSEGINTVLYDSNGVINYTLRAESQTNFNDDHTELERPFIRLFQDGESRWNIAANSGRISADLTEDELEDRKIELTGNVEVFSLDEYGNRTVMSTEYLEVDPQNETLETDQPVTLVTSNLKQSSIGMFADLKIDEIIFHRDIRGFYEKAPN
ncbi:MAG: LPS export ABC transporter periplasmic protein LptC [Gammaproteobacteria bacterium]|nr:LPS export ABC transporter periplasmic protein LptC [Gammaproteobacteria bacterium]MDD9960288.1 LPS export ABC transporter periplasmic protein LptC [Gammaproteobacteria bacterium]